MSFANENKILETLDFIKSDIERKLFLLSNGNLDFNNFLSKEFFEDVILKIAPKDKILHLLYHLMQNSSSTLA